jgi:putative ABC transport system permease protein
MTSLLHFFKITFRSIRQNRLGTFINVTGLALSISIVLFIVVYIVDEATFDSQHPDSESIYRLGFSYHRYGDGAEESESRTAGLWSVKLKEIMPEVKSFTRMSRFGYAGIVKNEEQQKSFVELEMFWVDTTFTNIFALPLVKGGDAKTIIKDPQHVIISEKAALKYFGNDDPLNKSLLYTRVGMNFNFVVGGVMKNYPANSHFHPDFIINAAALQPLFTRDGNDRINSWGDTFSYAYVKLQPGADPAMIDEGMKRVFIENLPAETVKQIRPRTIKMTDIHFSQGVVSGIEPSTDSYYLLIFGSIGALILLMACINYINLATIKSLKRVKEIGLKKTLGSGRNILVLQFLGEAFLTTIFAVALSILIFIVALPFFNRLAGKDFSVTILFQFTQAAILVGIVLAVTFGAGLYPSLYLSSFKPAEALSGSMKSGNAKGFFRKVLVVFQFSIAMLLIVGAIVIQKQLSMVNDSKLSEFRDQIICVRAFGVADPANYETLRNTILEDNQFEDVVFGAQLPRQKASNWIDTKISIPSLGPTTYIWQELSMSANFMSMFNLELIAGRAFEMRNPVDSSTTILNEKAVKDLHLTPDQALGLVLSEEDPKRSLTVIGVVRDFQYRSLKNEISPLMICANDSYIETMFVKISGTNYPQVIDALQKAWKKIYPSAPFDYTFLDDEFERMYEMENQVSELFRYFAVLAIVIGCLGLYGLASFTAEQKIKEIGIRKVLGSSVVQIMMLLTNRLLKLVAISFLIGIPLAYFLIQMWLENFAYKTQITADIFIISAGVILLMTFVTVGGKALSASLANPAESIRSE